MAPELLRITLTPKMSNGLRDARYRADLSSAEVGELIGFSAEAIRTWERCERDTVPRLAVRALCSIYWLRANDSNDRDEIEQNYRENDLWPMFDHDHILEHDQ